MDHFWDNSHMGENWFTYSDLYEEMVLRFPDGSHFVEIGSWKGRSASFMAVEIINSGKNIKLDCVDIWEDSSYYSENLSSQGYPTFTENLYEKFISNIKPVSHIINPIRSDSISAAANYLNGSLDFVFFDGDHSYVGLKRDLQCWIPKIKSGGVIAGHDYHCESVKNAVSEILGFDDCGDMLGNNCFIANIIDGIPAKYY